MPNRRNFLKNTLAVSLGSFLLPGISLKSYPFRQLESFWADVNLRFPEKTGTLTSSEIQMLWDYYRFIGSYWEMSDYINTTKESFASTLKLKTFVKPSYLYEYQSAISLLQKSKDDLKKFLLENTDSFSNKFVTLEFINLNLISGGFKKFGYKNYAGYMGGRFDNPSKIPYRV